MTSSVQMFPSTMKVDLMVTAFGLLAPEGQLIRTGGHMHHSRSAMTLSGMLNRPESCRQTFLGRYLRHCKNVT